ncbi:MAG: phenylacetate--CoA ligase family protein [Parvibaculaceae bacterium]
MQEPREDRSHSVGGSASLAQRFFDTLIALDFAPAQSLAAFQDNVLRDLITHVAAQSAFYRRRLEPVIDAQGTADLTFWHKVPILTAKDVAVHFDELRAQSIPKEHGRIFRYQSSGTTGRALDYYRSQLDELATSCSQYRHFRAMGVNWSKDLALIRAFDSALARFRKTRPEGSRQTWGPSWIAPDRLGALHRLSVFAPLEEQTAWLTNLGEIYLNTFPSNALALARHITKTGAPRPKLLAVLTAGEPMTLDVRHEVEAGLGCPCFDMISNAELGIMACECPARQGYHLQSELARIELLDAHNRPVGPGQWGRVVATPLYNFAMPLIRYDTGDRAKLKEACSCGRQHPLIDPLYGRPSNLLYLGPSDWTRPELSSAEMDKHLPGCRWQLVQTSPGQVELRYMRFPANESIHAEDAERYVASRIDAGIAITHREVAALGRNAGGKFPAFVSRVNEAIAAD